jgi:Ferritin-like domain
MTNSSEPQAGTALEELASDPSSRKRFLKMMGGGVAATSAFGILLTACGGDGNGAGSTAATMTGGDTTTGAAGSTSGDLEILNYALTLEYLEADFYSKVDAAGLFKGAQLSLLQSFGEHEQAHVEALTKTIEGLGGTPAAQPETTFPLDDAKSVAKLAATVENLGAAAYLGQAGRIQNMDVLAAALSIHTVEARHASALNALVGDPYTPTGAFAAPASMDEVLAKVKPFIVS